MPHLAKTVVVAAFVMQLADAARAAVILPTHVAVTHATGQGLDAHASLTLTATYHVPLMPADADFGDAVEVNMNGFAFAAACPPVDRADAASPGNARLLMNLTGRPGLGGGDARYAVDVDPASPTSTRTHTFVDRPIVLRTRYLRPDSPDAGAWFPLTVELHADAFHSAIDGMAVVAIGRLTLDVPWAAPPVFDDGPLAVNEFRTAHAALLAGEVATLPTADGDILLLKNFDGPLTRLPADVLANVPDVLLAPDPAAAPLALLLSLAARRRARRGTPVSGRQPRQRTRTLTPPHV